MFVWWRGIKPRFPRLWCAWSWRGSFLPRAASKGKCHPAQRNAASILQPEAVMLCACSRSRCTNPASLDAHATLSDDSQNQRSRRGARGRASPSLHSGPPHPPPTRAFRLSAFVRRVRLTLGRPRSQAPAGVWRRACKGNRGQAHPASRRGKGIFFKVVQASRLSAPRGFPTSGTISSNPWKLFHIVSPEAQTREADAKRRQRNEVKCQLSYFIFHISSFLLSGFPPQPAVRAPPFRSLRVRAAPPVFHCSSNILKRSETA